jgi:hypothetical protein
MSEDRLADLLEVSGNRTPTGPPPLERIVTGAARARRRNVARAVAVTVVLVSVVGGAWSLGRHTGGTTVSPVDTGPTPPPPQTSASGQVDPTNDLSGTWVVHALVDSHGHNVLPSTAVGSVRLKFRHGVVTGTTGCNDLDGRYVQRGRGGRDLVFPRRSLLTSAVGCFDEPPLLARMELIRHVSGHGEIRYLHAANWMIVIVLRRA